MNNERQSLYVTDYLINKHGTVFKIPKLKIVKDCRNIREIYYMKNVFLIKISDFYLYKLLAMKKNSPRLVTKNFI